MSKPKIICVIVTYNRLEKLKKTLSSYEAQTEKFYQLVIVDNHSSDGTDVYLTQWKLSSNGGGIEPPHIITMTENKGGSGGFYEGQKYAISLNPDWIFVADDDAYPEPDMIKKFHEYLGVHDSYNISALCTSVVYPDGTISIDHRNRHKIYPSTYFGITPIHEDEYKKKEFDLTMYSYVGTLMNVRMLRNVGLVNPNLFIYADDGEHSLRMSKVGVIKCLPYIKVIHDSGAKTTANDNSILVSWRDYYLVRNQINLFKKHSFISLPKMIWSFWKPIKSASPEIKELYKSAILDGIFGNLGIHKIYKPGWSLKQSV